jgi:hypothetical protein
MADNGQIPADQLYTLPGTNYLLDPVAAAAYLQMVEAAAADGVTWGITETYRSLETQVFAKKTKGGIMAPPGTSEHGLGKAIDLRTGTGPIAADRALPGGDPASNWLKENAARFGFRTLSGKNEPWHWEYTGDPADVAVNRGQKPAAKLDLAPNFILPNSGKPVPQRSIGGQPDIQTASISSPKVPARRPDSNSTQQTAKRLVNDLMSDPSLNLTREQAVGFVANLAHESAGFQKMEEVGSGSGFGYAQWTDSRRKEFERYAEAQGLDPSSYEANKAFIVHELKGKENGALRAIQKATDVKDATEVAMISYFRPGVPQLDRRVEYANQFAETVAGPSIPRPLPRPVTRSGDARLAAVIQQVNDSRRRAAATLMAKAVYGDTGEGAMSMTSELGDGPNFEGSVAAPRLVDYEMARDEYAEVGLLDEVSLTAPNVLPVDIDAARPRGPQGRGGARAQPNRFSVAAQAVASAGIKHNASGQVTFVPAKPAPVSPTVPARRPDTAVASAPAAEPKRQTAKLPSGKTVEVGRIYTIAGEDFIGGVKDGVGTLTKAPTSIIDEAQGKSIVGQAVRDKVVEEVGKGVKSAAAAVAENAPKVAKSAADGLSTIAGNVGTMFGNIFSDKDDPPIIVSTTPKGPQGRGGARGDVPGQRTAETGLITYIRKTYPVDSYGRPIIDAPVAKPAPKPKPEVRIATSVKAAQAAVTAAAKAPIAASKAAWSATPAPKASAAVRSAAAAVAPRKLTVAQIGQEADNARTSGYRDIQEMGPSSKGAKPLPAPIPVAKPKPLPTPIKTKPSTPWYTPPSSASIPALVAPTPLDFTKPLSAAPKKLLSAGSDIPQSMIERAPAKPKAVPKPGPVSTATVKPAPKVGAPVTVQPRQPNTGPTVMAPPRPPNKRTLLAPAAPAATGPKTFNPATNSLAPVTSTDWQESSFQFTENSGLPSSMNNSRWTTGY